MGAIHNKIKKIWVDSEYTQQDIAEKLNIHIKTWQKLENGHTRLDIERLFQIAEILETPIEELINADEGVTINEIKDNHVGFNNSTVHISEKSEIEKELYERIISEKERVIADKDAEIKYLRDLLANAKLN
ncbi:helix-turn-helix domain-containing protein [Sphingobacterium lactis]|uniref:helix-turn-helix domain-containing protein n=1 Tax=Sphingobacterium TaxID=28453 RepID=UPI000EC27CA4|nr:helix-turn-helix transcriptional regulator [Sphingobacterium hotanense]MCT1526767.1 helix-turn-helix domain-containing protein [Sphingobacterium hotanense]HAP95938.1 hypothetical protein [Chryseobacterium sp.]